MPGNFAAVSGESLSRGPGRFRRGIRGDFVEGPGGDFAPGRRGSARGRAERRSGAPCGVAGPEPFGGSGVGEVRALKAVPRRRGERCGRGAAEIFAGYGRVEIRRFFFARSGGQRQNFHNIPINVDFIDKERILPPRTEAPLVPLRAAKNNRAQRKIPTSAHRLEEK